MKCQFLGLLPLLSLLVPSNAGPIRTRATGNTGTSDELLGTTFGIPGNQIFDYVIVGGGTAGILQYKQGLEQ